jgi:hypothetical protein
MAYLTYFDLVEHLIVSSFGGPQDAEQRDIRTACQRAYSELTTLRDWSWYTVHGRVLTVAPVTGTVATYSNGTLTLSSGLTSTDWTHCKIRNTVAKIASATSSSIFVLDDEVRFIDAAVSAGDAVTFFKDSYDLPADFRNLDEPSDEYNWWAGLYVSPDEAMKLERVANATGRPYHWTVVPNDKGGYALKLVGYPTRSETVDFTYRRYPRQIKYSGHESVVRAGTITASSASVSGSSTTFPADCVGSVLRVGGTDYPEPLSGLKPYAQEVKILARASTTALTAGATVSATGAKYLITDPVDIPPHMHNAMYSCADYWLARIRDKGVDKAAQVYQRDLRLAMEQEQLAPLAGRSRQIWHNGGWRSPLLPDGGTL